MYEQRWKDMATKIAGRRRGQLWRADKDWFATPGFEKRKKDVEKEMMMQLKAVRRLDSAMTDDGWTKTRSFKKKGSVPFYIFLAHPELWFDDKELDRFLHENPKWKVGT